MTTTRRLITALCGLGLLTCAAAPATTAATATTDDPGFQVVHTIPTTTDDDSDRRRSIAAVGPDEVWVSTKDYRDPPLLHHLKDGKWTTLAAPDAGVLSATAPDDVWLLGGGDASGAGLRDIYHSTGGAFTLVPLPTGFSYPSWLVDVPGPTAYAAFAARDSSKVGLGRWGGAKWDIIAQGQGRLDYTHLKAAAFGDVPVGPAVLRDPQNGSDTLAVWAIQKDASALNVAPDFGIYRLREHWMDMAVIPASATSATTYGVRLVSPDYLPYTPGRVTGVGRGSRNLDVDWAITAAATLPNRTTVLGGTNAQSWWGHDYQAGPPHFALHHNDASLEILKGDPGLRTYQIAAEPTRNVAWALTANPSGNTDVQKYVMPDDAVRPNVAPPTVARSGRGAALQRVQLTVPTHPFTSPRTPAAR